MTYGLEDLCFSLMCNDKWGNEVLLRTYRKEISNAVRVGILLFEKSY